MWISLESHCCFQAQVTQPPPEEEEDAEEEEAEELGHVDTYAEYKPSKCMLINYTALYLFVIAGIGLGLLFSLLFSANVGISHPDIVVETNTLSSVPPPDVTYTLAIPKPTIDSGLLSALQLEAIIYACQVLTSKHNS